MGGVLGAEILFPEPVNWLKPYPVPATSTESEHRFNVPVCNARPWKGGWEQDRQSPCSHKQLK